MKDKFGNPIDPTVGYARGRILKGPLEETYKALWAWELIRNRVEKHGLRSIFSMIGVNEDPMLKFDDISLYGKEIYGGNPFIVKDLKRKMVELLGGDPEKHDVTFLNRGSGGNILSIMTLAKESTSVISLTPPPYSHSSIKYGVKFANAKLHECSTLDEYKELIDKLADISLVIITGVSVHLKALPGEVVREAIEIAKAKGIPVLLDDATGYLARPYLLDLPRPLQLDVDLIMACTEKGGLRGPRAGVIAGKKEYVREVETKAATLGMEARPIILAAIYRALEAFNPEEIRKAKEFNENLRKLAIPIFGEKRLEPMVVGGINIKEDDVLEIILERAGLEPKNVEIVPVEASCGVGMALLEGYGYYTIASIGFPGCTYSIRIKPIYYESMRIGDPKKVVEALDKSFDHVAEKVTDLNKMAELLLGDYKKLIKL